MGRMHAPGKGICTSNSISTSTLSFSSLYLLASSALPYRRAPPTWLKTTPEEVVEQIVKLARKGLTPSQIGVTLRDSHGIPQVRFVTGNKILRILKAQGTPSLLNSKLFLAHALCLRILLLLSYFYYHYHDYLFVWG